MKRFFKRPRLGLVACLLFLFVSCVPSADSVISPQFRLLPETSGLTLLNGPEMGGAAVFGFDLEVTNPNAFALRFSGIDGELFIGGQSVLKGFFPAANSIPAARSGVVALAISLPLTERSNFMADMANFISGEATPFRLIGTPVLSYFGIQQRLPLLEVFSTNLSQPLTLTPPTFIFDSSASRLSELSNETAIIDVALRLINDSPLGYSVLVPELVLELDGAPIEQTAVLSAEVGAFSEGTQIVQFEIATPSLNVITANEIRRLLGSRGSLGIGVSGEVKLELSGIASETFERRLLVSGFLK